MGCRCCWSGGFVGRVDSRLLLLCGFGITAVSLWIMSRYTLVLAQGDIVWPGVIQGFGLGLVFVPLSTVTFSTLEPAMFSQGTALYSLVRNIGSSIGISLVQTLWVRNTQVAHASLAETVTLTSRAIQSSSTDGYDLTSTAGLAALNGEVTRQASMIAYLDDFKLMLALTLLVLPLLWLIRPAKKTLSREEEEALHVAMD